MKKKLILSATILAMFLSMSFPTMANTEKPEPKSTTEMAAEAKQLTNRLTEINELDKSEMTGKEKRELRKEVRAINANLKTLGGGVYLSVGAIIIIVLLLILLL